MEKRERIYLNEFSPVSWNMNQMTKILNSLEGGIDLRIINTICVDKILEQIGVTVELSSSGESSTGISFISYSEVKGITARVEHLLQVVYLKNRKWKTYSGCFEGRYIYSQEFHLNRWWSGCGEGCEYMECSAPAVAWRRAAGIHGCSLGRSWGLWWSYQWSEGDSPCP